MNSTGAFMQIKHTVDKIASIKNYKLDRKRQNYYHYYCRKRFTTEFYKNFHLLSLVTSSLILLLLLNGSSSKLCHCLQNVSSSSSSSLSSSQQSGVSNKWIPLIPTTTTTSTPVSTTTTEVEKQHQPLALDEQQQQQQQQTLHLSESTFEELQLRPINLTQLILTRFAYLFDVDQQQQQQNWNNLQSQPPNDNLTTPTTTSTAAAAATSTTTNAATTLLLPLESQFSPLETRSNPSSDSSSSSSASDQVTSESSSSQLHKSRQRKYFRVYNRVFSRVELPEVFSVRRSYSSFDSSASSSPEPATSGTSSSSSSNNNNSPVVAATTLQDSSPSINSAAAAAPPPLPLAAAASSGSSEQCAPHIGCIEDLPNFPSLLKLNKLNVSASFTVYTRDGPRGGLRIIYEPLMHHQLADSSSSSDSSQATLSEWDIKQQFANSLSASQESSSSSSLSSLPSSASSSTSTSTTGGPILESVGRLRRTHRNHFSHHHLNNPFNHLNHLNHHHHHHHNHRNFARQQQTQQHGQSLLSAAAQNVAVMAAAAAAAAAATTTTTTTTTNTQKHKQRVAPTVHKKRESSASQQPVSANSWLTGIKIARSIELPFDLAAIEEAKFDASQETRIIIGGYFAKEDEEWIDELVRQWLLLEPEGNVIKVSWQEANRGLYHSAAHNSRIVGRQLSLFLHYLKQLYGPNRVDLANKFHLVGHSLGAHIAGFVGSDNDGQLARITGLDPAGPIFIELPASMRLDSSDARFVDVLHTNGGTITKGALGLSTPSGHVDYYCNGGSLQPGCYFSSMTKSIMDPVERIACNHRRSYRYFTELIKLAIQQKQAAAAASTTTTKSTNTNLQLEPFPRAFLFREPRHEQDLARLVHPELQLMRQMRPLQTGESLAVDERLTSQGYSTSSSGRPLTRRIEFHLMRPMDAEAQQSQSQSQKPVKGLYFFRTRSESPFFGSKQYALTLNLHQQIKRKLALFIKVNSTLVTELELDELSLGENSFLIVPHEPKLIDPLAVLTNKQRAPDLWLMWRQRSFNLLLSHHQNELQLNSIELTLMDSPESLTTTQIGDNNNNNNKHDEDENENLELNQADMIINRKNFKRTKFGSASTGNEDASSPTIQQVFTIRYGLKSGHFNVKNENNNHNNNNSNRIAVVTVPSEQQTNSNSTSTQTTTTTTNLNQQQQQQTPTIMHQQQPTVIVRNQWHKFADGRAQLIESQVIS